jgi:hypothetical protein
MRERLGRRPQQLNGFLAFLMGKLTAAPNRIAVQSVSEMLDGQCCKYQGNQRRHDGGAEREQYEHVDSKVSPASRQFVSTLNCDLEIGSACNRFRQFMSDRLLFSMGGVSMIFALLALAMLWPV